MTSQSRAICSQCRKIVKFVRFMALIFLSCESTCDLGDVSASIYDRKTAARPFDTIHHILRSLSFAEALLSCRNAPNLRMGNRGVKSENFVSVLTQGKLKRRQIMGVRREFRPELSRPTTFPTRSPIQLPKKSTLSPPPKKAQKMLCYLF